MRKAVLVAMLAGCAAAESHPRELLAGPVQKQQHHHHEGCGDGLHLELTDALGEKVAMGSPEQRRVIVVVLMSRAAKDEAADLLRELDEKMLNEPVDTLGIVDVRRFGGLTRDIAKLQLKRSAHSGRDKRRQRRQEHGVDASPEYVDRWHLVGDFDGKLLERFGVRDEPAHPLAFVVDRCGEVGGPHRDAAAVVTAVDHAVSKRASRSAGASRRARAWR